MSRLGMVFKMLSILKCFKMVSEVYDIKCLCLEAFIFVCKNFIEQPNALYN